MEFARSAMNYRNSLHQRDRLECAGAEYSSVDLIMNQTSYNRFFEMFANVDDAAHDPSRALTMYHDVNITLACQELGLLRTS